MVPGIAPEKACFTRHKTMHLAALWIRQYQLATQNVEHLVGRKDRSICVRVPKRGAWRQAKYKLVDLVAGYVDPVCYPT